MIRQVCLGVTVRGKIVDGVFCDGEVHVFLDLILVAKIPLNNTRFWGFFFCFKKFLQKIQVSGPFIVSKHLFKKSTFVGSTAASSMASMSLIFRDKYFNYSISYKRYSLLGGESFQHLNELFPGLPVIVSLSSTFLPQRFQ